MTGGARAAVFKGAAVLFGAEDGAARNPFLELGRRDSSTEAEDGRRGEERRTEGEEEGEHRIEI